MTTELLPGVPALLIEANDAPHGGTCQTDRFVQVRDEWLLARRSSRKRQPGRHTLGAGRSVGRATLVAQERQHMATWSTPVPTVHAGTGLGRYVFGTQATEGQERGRLYRVAVRFDEGLIPRKAFFLNTP